ncbi:MAG: DUF72 domain-containing protein [Gammaproteobacteria bacterium]|nr:DUF72 domain-containing protein [Gammaproteobacteria bacterium]
MQWLAGTSGYSYKEWKGIFYPEDLASDAMLSFYATRLPAVEINNTFYRMPRRHVLEGWHDAVPGSFRFVIKASRRITHHARLNDVEEPAAYLAEAVSTLEDKLGCVLFQLPPYLRKSAERLDKFLTFWPKELPAAVEFRHDSWFDQEIADILHKHGASICVSEDGKLPLPEFFSTTDWVYFRLRKPGYDKRALATWLKRGSDAGVESGFAFFKHEDEGAGPALAAKFLGLADADANADSRGSKAAALKVQAKSQKEIPKRA